ncbi:DUF4350 domain-containing protein [Paenibacillus oleatilyticus]|uniref:DUF4350 domain-containing protein n=1 Tax=Paenibacillus oleatilyticus TaxID=2594886 RepID=UPI001C1F4BD9|nr:DUF4350 domain-containing protein [Paenibacillus oleatilyticus]MBU7315522.1 DUF4350 domain-containing protein [Paenibacillus oleatilyticus]
MLKRNKLQIALAVSVVAFLLFGYVLVKPDLPDLPPYLSTSADRDGTKAVFTLLKEQGVPVKAWKQPWRSLPSGGRQKLIVIQPYAPLAAKEWEEIRTWVSAGNELVLFDDAPTDLEAFPLTRTGQAESGPAAITDLTKQSGAGHSGKVASAYRLKEAPGMKPLLKDARGIIAGRAAVGQGSVTLLLVPDWMQNDSILEHSHFELIRPYLQTSPETGALWFDEYHHGLYEKPGLLAVYPGWLLAVLLQLTLGALLWLWMKGVRFGPAYTPREWTVRRGDETLLAAAGWYERRGLAREALAHQARYVRGLMRERWGVRLDATVTQALAAAKPHLSKEELEQLAALMRSWQAAEEAAGYSPKQFEKDSRMADGVIRRLERE